MNTLITIMLMMASEAMTLSSVKELVTASMMVKVT